MFLVLVRLNSLTLFVMFSVILKFRWKRAISMIQREELEQILNFVANRWIETTKDPNNKALESLPNDFWMNSIGGKTAKNGFWVTTLMYTENEAGCGIIQRSFVEMASKRSR